RVVQRLETDPAAIRGDRRCATVSARDRVRGQRRKRRRVERTVTKEHVPGPDVPVARLELSLRFECDVTTVKGERWRGGGTRKRRCSGTGHGLEGRRRGLEIANEELTGVRGRDQREVRGLRDEGHDPTASGERG